MTTIGDVVQQYIKMRDYIKLLDAKHEAMVKPYKDGLTALENFAQAHLNEQNEQSVKTEHGTVFKKEWTQARLADKEMFIEFVMSADDAATIHARIANFFTAAISKDAVVEYMKETNGALPPGVDFARGWGVQFRKAS